MLYAASAAAFQLAPPAATANSLLLISGDCVLSTFHSWTFLQTHSSYFCACSDKDAARHKYEDEGRLP